MPVARNMKELEKMIMDQMKKKLPNATKDYCHKWYSQNPEVMEIVAEKDFVRMVNDSLSISISNGKLNAKFGIFNDQDIKEEHLEHMKSLWDDFKAGYLKHIYDKIFNQK